MPNLIKTPQQIMFEQAGIPHLAGGGNPFSSLTPGAKQLLEKAIERFKVASGRMPNASEMSQMEQHAASFSKPTRPAPNMKRLEATTPGQNVFVDSSGQAYNAARGPRGELTTPEQAKGYAIDPFGSTPANFRARKEYYDPRIKTMEDRDPFLTEAMTGRSTTRTSHKPFTTSLEDLVANKAALEQKGIYGDVAHVRPGDAPVQSTTPSSDFFAERSSRIENALLPDNLLSMLRKKLGHQPDEDEINAAIANMNPTRHDYTGKGEGIFGSRPIFTGKPTKEQSQQLAEWQQQAIDSGIAPSAAEKPLSRLRAQHQGLANEIDLGPDTGFKAGGHLNPDYMRAEMTVHGHTPQKFAKGGAALIAAQSMYGLPESIDLGKFDEAALDLANLGTASHQLAPKATEAVLGKKLPAMLTKTMGGFLPALTIGEMARIDPLNENEEKDLNEFYGRPNLYKQGFLADIADFAGDTANEFVDNTNQAINILKNRTPNPNSSFAKYKQSAENERHRLASEKYPSQYEPFDTYNMPYRFMLQENE